MEREFNSVEIFVAQGRIEAEFLAALLEEGGLEVGLRDVESTPFPTSGGIMGEIILVVHEDDENIARTLIDEAMNNGQISEKGYYIKRR